MKFSFACSASARCFSTKSLNYLTYKRPGNYLKVSEFVEKYQGIVDSDGSGGEKVSLTGRIMRIRSSGSNLHFIDLIQNSQKVQLILRQDNFPGQPLCRLLEGVQKGDIIATGGFPGRSQSGELSCKVDEFRVLTPCLLNLPDGKSGGITNPDLRASKRHLDLIANPGSYATFLARSRIISGLRSFLETRDFIEVETPILSDLCGGAVARPFGTRLSSQGGRRLSLRIAPELYLKRLVIGGFDRVFEVGKQFRDEGIDSSHSPEFTSCEFYAAYTDLQETASLLEALLRHCSGSLGGAGVFPDSEFKRIEIIPELERLTGEGIDPADPDSFLKPALLARLKPDQRGLPPAKVFDKLVSALIEPSCIEPTFLFGHPTFVSPLARECADRPGVADRFELFVGGRELANAYAELNDPGEQASRFRSQAAAQRAADDGEIPDADEEFVEALRVGMPPTTGCGIGIDRLVMLLTNQKQIRNVLLFPL